MARPFALNSPVLFIASSRKSGVGACNSISREEMGGCVWTFRGGWSPVCHLAQSLGIKSYDECIPVIAGESLSGHRPERRRVSRFRVRYRYEI